MGEFTKAVLERVRGAWDGLNAAHLARDAFAVALAADGLNDVLRVAHEHGIEPGSGVSGRGAG